jgi:hypothetical protein
MEPWMVLRHSKKSVSMLGKLLEGRGMRKFLP